MGLLEDGVATKAWVHATRARRRIVARGRKIGRTAGSLRSAAGRNSNAQIDLGRSDAIDERDAGVSCDTMEHAAGCGAKKAGRVALLVSYS